MGAEFQFGKIQNTFLLSSPARKWLAIAIPAHGLNTLSMIPCPIYFIRMFRALFLPKLILWFVISICIFDFYVYYLPDAQVIELSMVSM